MSTDGWASRKLAVCIGVFGITTAMLWFDKVAEQSWLIVTSGSVISYLAANVAEKWSGKPGA